MSKRKPKLPKTAAEFLAAIAADLEAWQVAIVEAEPSDTSPRRVMFWLDSDTERRGYVAHEHGRLIVTLGKGYHFDLDRLHEHHAQGWSWVKQMQDKSWCRPEHVELLLALEDLFPYDPPTA